MPTIMTHGLLPIAAAWALGPSRIARPVLVTGAVLAMLPDADVVGFRLGIDYADVLGHRGASHSLFVAAIVGALATALFKPERWRLVFTFLCASMAAHGLLDALTNGGLGPALFWPVDHARHFAPIRPILVSPIGAGFFSARGMATLLSEALWVWLPAVSLALIGRAYFLRRSKA